MNILVGMSGGVDSTTTALMLKEQGHNVIGVMMSIWGNSETYSKIADKMRENKKVLTHSACLCESEDEKIEYARNISEKIGIDFHVVDCSSYFEDIVLKNFKDEYLNGRTPNPCIWCNSQIKFGALLILAKKSGILFDKFATGHYANIEQNEIGRYIVKKGIVAKKDQSYFLYRLTQDQLKDLMFPLGCFTKEKIREIAMSYGLDVANKPDSQDFYEGNYNDILQCEAKIGNIVDVNGKIVGKHNGFWNYTIGQRKGLMVSASEPYYVLELNSEKNEVIVGFKDKTFTNSLIATNNNWIPFKKLENSIECFAKIRSAQEPVPVFVKPLDCGKIKVEFKNVQNSIALGQSVVLYDNDILLGGGIIDEVIK